MIPRRAVLACAAVIACSGKDKDEDDTAPQGSIFGQTLGTAGAIDARRVAVIEDTAYVCGGQDGLYRFDISEPASPTYVETLYLGGECVDMTELGGTLYAATGPAGFQVIRPDPILVQGVYVPENDFEVRSVGIDPTYAFAYLAEWDGSSARLERVDFTTADLPKLDVATGLGPSEPRALLENNETIYVTNADGALQIFGIHLDQLGGRPATFVGSGDSDLAWDDDYLYMVLGDSGLVSARVTDPEFPTDVYTWDGGGRSIHAASVTVDNRLYVALEGAIAIFDVTDPNAPGLVTGEIIPVSNLKRPIDITVAEGIAYIADVADNSLTLVDVDETHE